ncbi:cytosolic endo-beta-N-acetylglucosaminidase isoform X4 [Tupaia chinensis]|uniref:cytosolic endo-beta-N-acetylglucosaminidase isoform X4 n=1 Tax=Tupaia chinensis TaxID=246437 RepID=UPI0003C90ADD|nr:cytosolic endo-beta-N-acetylglucosaminidase isoform X4 [Tupaia chinensis]
MEAPVVARPPGRRTKEDEEEGEAVFREVVSFTRAPLPGRYYDKDTSTPISFYLSSLEELLAWAPLMDDGFNVALEPLRCRQPPLSSHRPRTLLCHDMMGGYLDDRFIQGSAVPNPYCFYHWQSIDVFVYFSHRMVTIPPVGWTNTAHRHGVCVLGTFITEWNEGKRVCEAFLAGDEHSYQAVADQLARMAQFFGFDGWLINIENALSAAAVGHLPAFLRYLTTQLHRQVPGGLVLWYDSVLQSGQLKWQDELNEQNRVFFDSCDGFFTNYNWQEEHLERMRGQAGERLADIYVGVDVFARGNVVGGRFDTDKSLELIRKHGFSVALFAPGWVYECLEKRDFFKNQDKLFSLQVPLPPRIFLSMVYKFEGPTDVGVGLELTTGDAGSCHVGGISVLSADTGSRHRPQPLRVPPTKLARWVGRCGQMLSGGWVQRCYEVSLRGCLLLDLLVSFSRPPGSQEEKSFVCRLGEIQVVGADSLLAPLPQVQAVTVSLVHWRRAGSEPEGRPAPLQLSCSLHWSYPLPEVRCFRVHCRGRAGVASPLPALEEPVFLGLAFANQYRVVDLAVEAPGPGQDGRVQFLVEPVPKEGFLVPAAEWGRATLLYSGPE